MAKILTHAVAKVNLMLNILRKNQDGYHEIESVFIFLSEIFDGLEFDTDIEFNENSGNIKGVSERDNSIKKAYQILKDNFDFKIPHVSVQKNLPISSGIGGGSSDAACFVNTVFDIWEFSIEEKLKYINLFIDLGSDTKIFLYKYFTNSDSAYLCGTGITGTIQPLSLGLKDCYVALVNDGSRLSTKQVYDNFKGNFCEETGFNNIDFNILKKFHNSLQKPAIVLENSIQKVLDDIRLTNPIFSGVSGSGPTCFGFYDNFKSAYYAVNNLKYEFVKMSHLVS